VETGDLVGLDVDEAARIATERLRDAVTALERSIGSTPPELRGAP
jgi:hypothetical protein